MLNLIILKEKLMLKEKELTHLQEQEQLFPEDNTGFGDGYQDDSLGNDDSFAFPDDSVHW